jgi:hypothetical protein|tara:strand:- start:68 stop:607 length:540 start_codon:yes stop_codon:yes gene_type:complete
MSTLLDFYKDSHNIHIMMNIINGDTKMSLRIVDWFVTNYAKKHFTVYELPSSNDTNNSRFKVYNEYKLKLKAYSKKRFDPFCRWDRITIPYNNNQSMETTIGQLNFFKWAIENNIIDYIQSHFQEVEQDMNNFNSTAKRRTITEPQNDNAKTRKKREELSVSACKCIKKETVKIIVKFD